jgi:hypothetical protein
VNKLSQPSLGYTHSITLTSKIVNPATLRIKLLKQLPTWLDQINDDNGDKLISSTMEETFGIAYLYKGFYDAFTVNDSYYTDIVININK